jgi:hypothetical protein
MSEIRALFEGNSLAEGCEIPVVGASGSQAIGEWWDASFDRDLIRGTAMYGYGAYRKMRMDPNLVFLGRVEPLQPKSKGEDGKNGLADEDDSDLEMDDDEQKKDEGRNPNATIACNSRDLAMELQVAKKETVGINSPGKSEDADDEEAVNVAYLPREELLARKWPLVQVLNIRVRKLVRGFGRLRKKADRQAKVDLETERARQAKEEKRLAREAVREEQELERERRAAVANRLISRSTSPW